MKISGIDKDFVNIINYLDANGFKPYSSCDGVEANHKDKSSVGFAYIAFMKSPQIIQLMSAFLRDKENFFVSLSTATHTGPQELYGNIIEGNHYTVYFQNKLGTMTSYFNKIITGVTEGSINISDEEMQNLIRLEQVLEKDENSDLDINVTLNSKYQAYLGKAGKVNVLTVRTKEGILNGQTAPVKKGYIRYRDMNTLLELLTQKFGILRKNNNDDTEVFDEDEFATNVDNSSCEIYFSEEHFEDILEQIKYIRSVGDSLPIREGVDPDSIEWDEEEQDY